MQLQENKEDKDWDLITPAEVDDLYKKVLEFYEERGNPPINIIWLSNLIIKRLRKDFDFYSIIEGGRGMGKSNLITLLGLLQTRNAGIYKNKKTGKLIKVLPRINPLDPNDWEKVKVGFKFNQNMSFLDQTLDIKKKFNLIDRYSAFIIDEGSKNLHKYNWQTNLQFMLIKLSDTSRYQNKSFFICFPNFRELNSVFRNDRVSCRLYLYDRVASKNYSSCIISLKNVNRFCEDPWNNAISEKIYENVLKRVPISGRTPKHILLAEKKLPNFSGAFDVPSLRHIAPRIWRIYEKYKVDNALKDIASEKDEIDSKIVTKWKMSFKRLVNYVLSKYPTMNSKDFEKITSLNAVTIKRLLETGSLETEK